MDLGFQTMLLTGAASGIGRHLAGALSGRGHRVFATDVDAQALEAARLADGWSSTAVRTSTLDVRREEDWARALADCRSAFGEVQVLLNVAGYLRPGTADTVAAKDIDLHLDVNVKGVVLGMRVVGAHFVERKAGHIINLGSLASLAPAGGLALYVASKFAVRGYSLAAAQDFAAHGVAVSLVMPDAVQTPMLELQVDYPEAAMTFSGSRALTVEDIEHVLVDEVLPRRPLEVAVPLSRGLVARFANAAPGLALRLAPLFRSKGLKAQAAQKASRGEGPPRAPER